MRGLLTCMNFSESESFFLYLGTGLGIGEGSRGWWTIAARCRGCSRRITVKHGVFCANFGVRVFGSRIYQSAWCATCYRAPLGVDFLVYRPRDKVTGELLIEEGTERRYLEARPGDHLLCPFECESCGFRRLSGAWARVENHTDEMTMNFMRRANLDAF
jgi:hypothetical protein